jgi:hypothetical protein
VQTFFTFQLTVDRSQDLGLLRLAVARGADAHGAPRSGTTVVVGAATDTEHALLRVWRPAGELVRLTVIRPGGSCVVPLTHHRSQDKCV